jgi:signal transduction histidine kinase
MRSDHTAHLHGLGLMHQVDATHLLQTRTARARDPGLECQALLALADTFAQAPEQLAAALADTAMRLTSAHAAGLSLEELGPDRHVFRWIATAGSYRHYLHQTLPRDFSPCGEVLARNGPVLMQEPARLYPYINALQDPVHEALLVPFHHRDKPVGTVWVVSHDASKAFDREDLRLVEALTRFAAAAVHTLRSVERLNDVDRRKDQFLAALAHEMRSPLAVISMSAELARHRDGDPTRRKHAIEVIEWQAGQLARLVDDITDMASIHNGKFQLRPEPVIVQDIIARALETCGASLEAGQHALQLQLPDQPVAALADPGRLTQVLVNLLNNAVKFTPPGGTIKLFLHSDAAAFHLGVQDSGIGMAPEDLPRVFDMYMQVRMESRPPPIGLGIGLSLVKQFVELHGGTVTASSPGLGQGSLFEVTLPLPPHTGP